MSGALFHTPSDVRAYKNRLDPFVRSLDATVTTCATLDPMTRRAWAEFARAWRSFCDADEGWFDAGSGYDTAASYETHIRLWQQHLSSACRVPGPALQKTPAPEDSMSSLRVVAIAGAVIAVALAVRSVTR